MIAQAHRLLRRAFGQEATKERKVRELYRREGYLEAYSRHTDMRVEQDPRQAVGGHWEEMGKLQFDFMTNSGLEPAHSLLDIGCGTLRGGRHFIRYLEIGRYTGIDISEKAITYGRQLLFDEDLERREPRLVLNEQKHLTFANMIDETFDCLLAHAVFPHLPKENITECFQNASKVMNEASQFFFTFAPSDDHERHGDKNFSHPWSFFCELAVHYGYRIQDLSAHYPHPQGHRMAMIALG